MFLQRREFGTSLLQITVKYKYKYLIYIYCLPVAPDPIRRGPLHAVFWYRQAFRQVFGQLALISLYKYDGNKKGPIFESINNLIFPESGCGVLIFDFLSQFKKREKV